MKILILISYLFVFKSTFCQHPVTYSKADSLLEEISRLQIKEKSFYEAGQFPSQRGHYRRVEDNTIFFSSLIAFTLQGIRKQLAPELGYRIDSITKGVILNYNKFQNKTGIKTFNFWKTDPPVFFPNSRFLSHWEAFHIPDDADCTSMIHLTDTSLIKHAAWLQQQFAEHANLSKMKIKNTFRSYRHFKAYATWFGKKMPIEFDLCVQSNMLYFIYKNHLSLTTQDRESLLLIHDQIHSGNYLKYAYYFSPSYKKKAIVLYHLARLLENNYIQELEDCREIIKEDIVCELQKTKSFMDKVILCTSLIRMGQQPAIKINITPGTNHALKNYVFFRANLLSSYARPSLRFLSKINLLEKKFYCRAYCLSLLAEYETYRVKEEL